MNKLTPESSITDLFDYYDASAEGGCQVVPVTIKQQSDDTRMLLLIRGEHQMASAIMAEVMSKVNELFDYSQQAEASEQKSDIIVN